MDWIAVDAACLPVGLLLHAVHEPHARAPPAWHADRIGIESPFIPAGVPEDRVVLAAEATPALTAHRVAPYDLVDKALPAEQPIERDLHIVHCAIVKMYEQRAVRREHAMTLLE